MVLESVLNTFESGSNEVDETGACYTRLLDYVGEGKGGVI